MQFKIIKSCTLFLKDKHQHVTITTITSESLITKYLINNKTYDIIDSTVSHKITINLFDCFPIPLSSLLEQDLYMTLQYENIKNLVNNVNNIIPIDIELDYHFRNTNNAILQEGYELYFNRYDTVSKIIDIMSDTNLHIKMNMHNYASSVCILVQTHDDKDINDSVIDNIEVLFNGYNRHHYEGDYSRIVERTRVPYDSCDDPYNNIYFISYHNGLYDNDNNSCGAWMKRLDNYYINLKFNKNTPKKIKLSITHHNNVFYTYCKNIFFNKYICDGISANFSIDTSLA